MPVKEYKYSDRLMGTDFQVSLFSETDPQELFQQLKDFGGGYEKQFSRFQSTSELSQVNKHKQYQVSEVFRQLFNLAQDLFQDTEGVFNPLLSPYTLGYDRDFILFGESFSPLNQEINTDFSSIVFDPTSNQIKLKENQTLDFGGFLKGWLVQKMQESVVHLPASIINLGGDIASHGTELDERNFIIKIKNPIDLDKPLEVAIKNKVLATSGVYKRKWKGGLHHILDPKTKTSCASDIISATVIHDSGAYADAYATVAVILGSEKARVFLDQRDCEYVLIRDNGDIISRAP